MLLKDIMKEAVVKCSGDATLREAAKKLVNNRVGCLVITEKEVVKGILTKSDVVRSLAESKDVDYCKVRNIMKTNIKSCTPDKSIQEGAKVMTENRVKRLPVLDEEGKLIGLVSISELTPILNKEVADISSFLWG